MNGAVFALAASSFSRPSETFIRDHAHTIAPGRTVLLCHEPSPASMQSFPFLDGVDMGAWPDETNALTKAYRSARRYWRRYGSPFLSVQDSDRVAAFLNEQSVTAVMAEYGPTGVMLQKAAYASQTPLFVHFHGFDAAVMGQFPLWPARYRRLFDAAEGIIAPSRFIANKLAAMGCPEAKLHVCACGIDPTRFAPSTRASSRLIAVGRLVAKKAPHVTIDAFSKVADQFPEARLDIVGDGPLAERCRALVKERGMTERILLHGRQSHDFVATLMGEAYGFVQHSVTSPWGDVEGLPVSILEAMASALPVVSTRHSGIPEAVDDGVTGLLVDERDTGAMAAAIAEILSDPARAAAMGDAGRARVLNKFTQEKTGETLRAIMGL